MEGQGRAPAEPGARQGTLPSRDPPGTSPPLQSRIPGPRPAALAAPHLTQPEPPPPPQPEPPQPPLTEPFFRSAASAAAESFGGLRGQPSTKRHFRPGKHRLPRQASSGLAGANELPEVVGGAWARLLRRLAVMLGARVGFPLLPPGMSRRFWVSVPAALE